MAQRGGLFGRLSRLASKTFAKRDLSGLTLHADAIDGAVHALYRDRRRVVVTFAVSLVAWVVGTGEVWLALDVLGHPVSWRDALLLESVGQAIRGAAFAIPGSLGAQEGGFLLLAPLVGLPLDTALALSLVKRAREIALGLPGIVCLHLRERHRQTAAHGPDRRRRLSGCGRSSSPRAAACAFSASATTICRSACCASADHRVTARCSNGISRSCATPASTRSCSRWDSSPSG